MATEKSSTELPAIYEAANDDADLVADRYKIQGGSAEWARYRDAYVRGARWALEEAAKVIDGHVTGHLDYDDRLLADWTKRYAEQIRSLKNGDSLASKK